MEFTQEHAESLITMEEKLNSIIHKLDDMDVKIDKKIEDHECRIRDVEIHGSPKLSDIDDRLKLLEKCFGEMKSTIDYERGRLAIIVILVGSFISFIISKLT